VMNLLQVDEAKGLYGFPRKLLKILLRKYCTGARRKGYLL